MRLTRQILILAIALTALTFSVSALNLAAADPKPGSTPGKTILVTLNANGSLAYAPYSAKGDIIPDFSHCGYGGGGVDIPVAPVRETLDPSADPKADDTTRIQAALDRVAALPLQADGLRGAVLLKRGAYRCADTLLIKASGVVLRGEGEDEKGTILIATAPRPYSIISVGGVTETAPAAPAARATRVTPASRAARVAARSQSSDDGEDEPASSDKTPFKTLGAPVAVTDAYVPVGSFTVNVADATKFAVGQTVYLIRHGNAAWIHEIAMDRITPRPKNPQSTKQWQPFNLRFDRVITAIDGNRVTLDAPLVCAIDKRWGGGSLVRYSDAQRIQNCGVENLRGDSYYDPKKLSTEGVRGGAPYAADEDHARYLVSFDAAKNCWAQHLTAIHFYNGPAQLNRDAKWITVEDCSSLDPVSVITGGRRYPFNINGAQLCLIQRCYSDHARHAFVVGARVPGPNVFLNCRSTNNHATSEPHHRWSTGGLYDNVDAHMAIQDRQYMGSGHGWAGANYVVWNSKGTLICQQPPTAQNFAIGFTGQKMEGAFKPRPDGWWESLGKRVEPESLYLAQLKARQAAH